MAFSPRSTSKSTITAAESCSSPTQKQNGVRGYYNTHTTSDPWVPANVYGTFNPMVPYIYCQSDPSYTGEAATAVFVVMYFINSLTSRQGQAQIGLRKHREPGTTNILTGVYFELSYYPLQNYPSDPQHRFMADIAPMPSSATNLTVSKDCNTGIIKALVGGVDMTPSVGSGSNQIDPALWTDMVAMQGFAVGVAVELHDIRSHGPGTTANPYYIVNSKFDKCSGSTGNAICGGITFTNGNPPPELNIGRSGLFNGDFKTWDTRN